VLDGLILLVTLSGIPVVQLPEIRADCAQCLDVSGENPVTNPQNFGRSNHDSNDLSRIDKLFFGEELPLREYHEVLLKNEFALFLVQELPEWPQIQMLTEH
jgi:hypothetical protein